MSQISRIASKAALALSAFLLALATFVTVSRLYAVQGQCMTCSPSAGCVNVSAGYNNCASSWENGQQVSCTLSGGACGS